MKILIEISEESYTKLTQKSMLMSASAIDEAVDAVKNGIVLPNGHGDLIDRYNLLDNAGRYNYKNFQVITVARIMAEDVVIPAEKGES